MLHGSSGMLEGLGEGTCSTNVLFRRIQACSCILPCSIMHTARQTHVFPAPATADVFHAVNAKRQTNLASNTLVACDRL